MDWLDAREAYPDIRTRDGFAAHVEACTPRGAKLDHAGELFIAWASGRGDAAALRHLERLISPEVDAVARRTRSVADELRQALRVRLLVADGGRVRIDDYAGRGPLRSWLGVAALRLALNLKRGDKPVGHDIMAEIVSGEADPELRHLKTLYRAEFREALETEIAALPDGKRAMLRLTFVDGLKAVQLARLYQVHETTAARWIAAAAAEVADGVKRRLMARLVVSASSFDSIARMVLSNLDLSIARVLGG